MRRIFADTHYWVAILNDQDQSHQAARSISQTIRGTPIVTTEEALTEVLAFFCERGQYMRQAAIAFVEGILTNPAVTVREQSHQTFMDGFAFYKSRPDKGYSLTDCISMLAMRREEITEVLTDDDHFTQEGFTKLL
jgi:predicted nucleic acid-binding protein